MSNETTFEQQDAPTAQEIASDQQRNPEISSPDPTTHAETAAEKTQEVAFQLSPKDQFAEYDKEYKNLDSATLTYILGKKRGELAQTNRDRNSFSAMNPTEAAALLLAIEKNGYVGNQTAIEELRSKVTLDTSSGEFYFPERMNRLTAEEAVQEAISLSAVFKNGKNIPLAQLESLASSVKSKQSEIDLLIHDNPEAQMAIQDLEAKMDSPEVKVAAMTQATENIEVAGENPTDNQLLAELSTDAEVVETERIDDGLLVTVQEKNSPEVKKVKVTEGSIWKFVFIAAMSDSLMGTNKMEEIGRAWTQQNILFPVLAKLGIDPKDMLDTFTNNKFDAFDGMLKIMNNRTCEEYFDDAIKNKFLFDTLEKCRPEHLKKIFHPDGSQPFGKSGYFGFDHLQLSPALVKKMRESLTERQRQQLRLPTPTDTVIR